MTHMPPSSPEDHLFFHYLSQPMKEGTFPFTDQGVTVLVTHEQIRALVKTLLPPYLQPEGDVDREAAPPENTLSSEKPSEEALAEKALKEAVLKKGAWSAVIGRIDDFFQPLGQTLAPGIYNTVGSAPQMPFALRNALVLTLYQHYAPQEGENDRANTIALALLLLSNAIYHVARTLLSTLLLPLSMGYQISRSLFHRSAEKTCGWRRAWNCCRNNWENAGVLFYVLGLTVLHSFSLKVPIKQMERLMFRYAARQEETIQEQVIKQDYQAPQ